MTDLPIILDGPAGNTAPERLPGDFRRNHQGAPWVAHPTDTVQPRGNKADLVATCERLGLVDPDGRMLETLKNDELRNLIGSEPKWALYGRPSSFGKELDDGFNLQRWKERHLVRGLDILGERLDVADLDDSDIDGIVARAYQAAGTSLAADRGTHVHTLTEWVDNNPHSTIPDDICQAGEALGIPVRLQVHTVNQWFEFRRRLGIEAVRIEQPIVNDELQLAGTFDRLDHFTQGLDTTLGRLEGAAIADIKTGNPHRITYPLQMVAYRDGQPYDPDTDQREEWPMTPHAGIAVIYWYDLAAAINGEPVDWQIVPVDLTIARTGARHVLDARRYAKRDDVFAPTISPTEEPCSTAPISSNAPTMSTSASGSLTPTTSAPPTSSSPSTNSASETDNSSTPHCSSTQPSTPELSEPTSPSTKPSTGSDEVSTAESSESTSTSSTPPTTPPTSPSPSNDSSTGSTAPASPSSSPTSPPDESSGQPDRSTETRRQRLRDRYSALTTADQQRFIALGINPDDLDAIEAGLNQIDPFAQTVEPTPRQGPTAEPRPVGVDEGEPATPDELDAVRAAWALLEPDQAAWVKSIVAQVGNLSIDQNPSKRRVAIGFALVQLAAAGWHDVTLLRACLAHAAIDDLSVCGVDGAASFALAVQALVNEELQFAVSDDGDMQLIAA